MKKTINPPHRNIQDPSDFLVVTADGRCTLHINDKRLTTLLLDLQERMTPYKFRCVISSGIYVRMNKERRELEHKPAANRQSAEIIPFRKQA
jgi:hypothetical protein